ncbi:uncharacterized protein LOC121238512 isoform X1 [Juglans microcarpa x Juglans regia]|uniref:uncharacterized protein LOC121238512 isoform X1 n=1 Tax=Juglans microcarpa x Juglans regia TaxID=2249226 RepID=UPI001B7DCE7C|nr:uncharacterized protein LOC121238512 isoform X1 [Juglans microcarpa x Juglans regia]
MADWSPCTKNHFPFSELNSPIQPSRRTQGKSFTNFLCKSLFFALFLILLPLFPSQAPEFINQKFLTKFWELLHLLFIGIAVSYGLFGRRNVELGIDETHSNFDISQSSVSRMFHVSSIFEDGFENPCGPDENSLINSWNSQYIESEHINSCDRSSGVGEKCKSRYGRDRNNVVQAWNSQYFQGEPTVVVARPNYSVEKWGRTASLIDHKPLGLPVRSLKSKVRKLDCPEFISGSESGSGSNVTSRSDRSRSGNFGDLGPMSLEQRFNEAAAAASPIPWRSRSIRTETRNEAGDVNLPTHFRPLSVDETQFESLKSRSVRSTGSFSSQSSSVSSSSSISSELPNSRTEDLGKSKSFLGAFREASPSPPTPRNGKASSDALHSRHCSSGSVSGRDAFRNSEDELKEKSRSRREDPSDSEDCRMDLLKSNMNPASPTKAFLRGKSVRNASSNALHSRHCSSDSVSGRDDFRNSEDELKEKSRSRREDPSDSEDCRTDLLKSNMNPASPTKAFLRGKSVRNASSNALHSRHCSSGSVSGRDAFRNSEDELKEKSRSRREDPSDSEDCRTNLLKSNMNPASPTKAFLRGKSVRTIRASALTAGAIKKEERCQNQNNDKAEKKHQNLDEACMRKDKTKVGLDDWMIGSSEQRIDNLCPMPKPKATFSEFRKKEKEEFYENLASGSEEDLQSERENLEVSSDEYDVSASVNDSVPSSDEVDKRADEFIAKFREQIMLQKMASIERSRGLQMGRNRFR